MRADENGTLRRVPERTKTSRVSKENVEHGRTDRTNVTRRRNKIPGHRT